MSRSAAERRPAGVMEQNPGFSLLRLSLAGRLALVGAALAALWAGVFWALS